MVNTGPSKDFMPSNMSKNSKVKNKKDKKKPKQSKLTEMFSKYRK